MADMNESGVILQGENQKYFLLNINECENDRKRKNTVYNWIKKERFAPIFFDGHTIDQIKNKNGVGFGPNHHKNTPHRHKDAEIFVDTFSKLSNTNDKIVFSIGEEKIYFFKQGDELSPFKEGKEGGVKGFPIKDLEERDIKECPLVLAGMKANLHFALGTFKEVKPKYFGNIQAIKYLLSGDKPTISNFSNYLKCLSSVELETLVAKILEERELFIPAYKGGFIKNFDLVCRNFGKYPIDIGKVEIKPNDTKLIQVKLTLEKNNYNKDSDYLYFCIDSNVNNENVFKADDIEKLLGKSETYEWLKKSLCWVEFVKNG